MNNDLESLSIISDGDFTLESGATIAGKTITLTSDNLIFNPGTSIDAGTGTVKILTKTGDSPITIGGTGTEYLTVAELDLISASVLDIGNRNTASEAITGPITITGNVTPSSTVNNLILRTGGSITQTTGVLTAVNLEVDAGAAVSMGTTTYPNNVNNLAVMNTGGAVSFTNEQALGIGVIGVGTDGISSGNNSVMVTTTTEAITVSKAIAAGTGNVTLNAKAGFVLNADITGNTVTLDNTTSGTGGISQTGKISAAKLEVKGTYGGGGIILNGGAAGSENEVSLITTNTTGQPISFKNRISLTIGVGATGIISNGGNVTISEAAGDITVAGAGISTAGGDVTLTTDAGDISVNGPVDSDGGGITITSAVSITTTASYGTITSNAGTITLVSDDVTLNGDIDAGTGLVKIWNKTSAAVLDIGSISSYLKNSDLANITASNLEIGNNTLTTSITFSGATTIPLTVGNVKFISHETIGTITVNALVPVSNAAAGNISFEAGGAVIINGSVSNTVTGNISASGSAITVAGAGISATSGNVTLTTTSGDISVNGLVSGAGITLYAGGAVIQTGAGSIITATTLTVTAGGVVTLDQAPNLVNALAVTGAGGNVSFTNNQDLVIGVSSIGINAPGRIVYLETTTGTIRQTRAISAAQLAVNAAGSVALDHVDNVVGVFAAKLNSGGSLTLTNKASGALSVSTVGGITGIVTSDGYITITQTAGSITVSEAINAGNNKDITLNAKAGFTLAANITGGIVTLANDNTSGSGGISQTISTGIVAGTGLLVKGKYGTAIGLNGDNAVKVFAADTSGENLTFNNSDSTNHLVIRTVDTTNGVTTGGQTLTISEAAGNITVDKAINSDGGDITITSAVSITTTASDGTITSTSTSNDGTITLVSNNVTLNGDIIAGTGLVKIWNKTSAALDIGSGAVYLTDADLANITASNLEVGDDPLTASIIFIGVTPILSTVGNVKFISHGTITVNASVLVSNAVAGNISFEAGESVTIDGSVNSDGGDITITSAGNIITTASSGAISAAGNISASGSAITIDGAGLSAADGDVTLTTTSGDISVIGPVNSGDGNITITSAGNIITTASSGAISAAGNISASGSVITIDGAGISAADGDVTLTTDSGNILVIGPVNSGIGDITITSAGNITTTASSGTIISSNGTITLVSDDVILDAAINADTGGAVRIRNKTPGTPIFLGNLPTSPPMVGVELTTAELILITASILEIGDRTDTPLVEVTASTTLTAVGTVFLRATNVNISTGTVYTIGVKNLAVDTEGDIVGVLAGGVGGVKNVAMVTTLGDISISQTEGDLTIAKILGIGGVYISGLTAGGGKTISITIDGGSGLIIGELKEDPIPVPAAKLSAAVLKVHGINKVQITLDHSENDVGMVAALLEGAGTFALVNNHDGVTLGLGAGDGWSVKNSDELVTITQRQGDILIAEPIIAGTGKIVIEGIGNVTVNAGFSGAAWNSTIKMTGGNSSGTATYLTVNGGIGNLTIDDHVALYSDELRLAGSMEISGGGSTFYVRTKANGDPRTMYVGIDWTINPGGVFECENSNIVFTGENSLNLRDDDTIRISGNTTWYDFTCEAPGKIIQFSNHPDIHHVSHKFLVKGSATDHVYLDRGDITFGDPLPPKPTSPTNQFWYFTTDFNTIIDIANITIKYSWSDRRLPIPSANSGRNVFAAPYYNAADTSQSYYNINWVEIFRFFYAFTEDSDGNGRIDRIRAQAAVELNGDFTKFEVELDGFELDTARPQGPYQMVEDVTGDPGDGDSIYIYLQEHDYADGAAAPVLKILTDGPENTLRDRATGSSPITEGTPISDTVFPRITYTLMLPNSDKVFVQFSEMIDDGLMQFSLPVPGTPIPFVPVSPGLEYELTLPSIMSAAELAAGNMFTVKGVKDRADPPPDTSAADPDNPPPKYPTDWKYTGYSVIPPGTGLSPPNGLPLDSLDPAFSDQAISHRLTDILVSLPPTGVQTPGNEPFFVWPVWAMNPQENIQSEQADIHAVRNFSGMEYLEEKDITLQVNMNAAFVPGGYKPELFFSIAIPGSLRAGAADISPDFAIPNGNTGLWLPNFDSLGYNEPDVNIYAFSNMVPNPYADAGRNSSPAAISNNVFNFSLSKSNYTSVSMLEFFFRLSGGADSESPRRKDLYIGRLANNSKPWYRRVEPFKFEIHNITRQRSGATVLNNVIKPSTGERVYLDYKLTRNGPVTIQVFTLDGTLVKVLVRENKITGEYRTSWDGKNNGGREVARGMYFIRVVAPDIDEIRKVMVVK
ncbi:hypothetical protein LQZ19_05320 [Treponema primitia]|uniref:hypothetical protein n=1 Tax=Treponema primitia TaxID=88058 RepID=UPI0039807504